MNDLLSKKCEACRADAPKITASEIEQYLPTLPQWKIIQEDSIDKLTRCYALTKYSESLSLVNAIAELSELEGHHSVMIVEFRQVTVTWWSHKMRGLHVNDFIMAAKCDHAYEKLRA